MKQYNLGMEDYNKAIMLDPQDPIVYKFRGHAQSYVFNNHLEAIKDYNKAIRLKPYDAKAIYDRALIKLYFVKNEESALSDFNKILEMDIDSMVYYNSQIDKELFICVEAI